MRYDSELVRVRTDGSCRTGTKANGPPHLAVGGDYVYVAIGTTVSRTRK